MTRRIRGALALCCALTWAAAPLAIAGSSDAAIVAYGTATDAAIAAYNTAMDAAHAAYLTAKNAAEAAYGTATDAADAAYATATAAASAAFATAAEAAVAAYGTAVTAATAAYGTAVTAADGDTTAIATATAIHLAAKQSADSTYAGALAAAQTLYSTASAAPDSDYALALAAAESGYAQALHTANAIYALAVANAEAVCTAAGNGSAAVYAGTGPAPPDPVPKPGCPVEFPSNTPQPAIPGSFVQQAPPTPASYTRVWAGAQVERAFARRHAVLDAAGHQPLALTSGVGLFPEFGFTPPESTGSWSLQGVNADQSVLCTSTPVRSFAQWSTLLAELVENGMKSADSGCAAAAAFAAPTSFPHTVTARKVLDRRDYILPTVVPSYLDENGDALEWPVLGGFPKRAALPSITLWANPGQVSAPAAITVFNTPRLIATVPVAQFLETGIVAITVRDGFTAQHTCAVLEGGQTCEIAVRYLGDRALSQRVGSLRVDFTNGEFAVISLLGLTRPN